MLQPDHQRTGRPSLEAAAEIDRRILDVGKQMFLQHGYGVTMNAIVQAAGLTRKTVYARYNNKEALFVAVLRQLMRSAPESRPELDEHGPLEEALRSFILNTLTQLCRPEVLAIRQLMVANRDLVARVRPDIIQAIDRDFIEPLQNFLEKAQARGDIGATDSWAAARALTTLLFAEAHRHLENSESAKSSDLMAGAHFLTSLFCNGITGDRVRR